VSTLCFGTLFSLFCGNKKDWDKPKKPEVANRMLYFALLDIVDKHTNPTHHANLAESNGNTGYKDDVASDAKICKKNSHPIQWDGNKDAYIKRFENEHSDVCNDFYNYVLRYFDEKQYSRFGLSVVELVVGSGLPDDTELYIFDDIKCKISKEEIANNHHEFNLPSLLAGVLYHILKENTPNVSGDATIAAWKDIYTERPFCPIGEAVSNSATILFIEPSLQVEDNPANNIENKNNTDTFTSKKRTPTATYPDKGAMRFTSGTSEKGVERPYDKTPYPNVSIVSKGNNATIIAGIQGGNNTFYMGQSSADAVRFYQGLFVILEGKRLFSSGHYPANYGECVESVRDLRKDINNNVMRFSLSDDDCCYVRQILKSCNTFLDAVSPYKSKHTDRNSSERTYISPRDIYDSVMNLRKEMQAIVCNIEQRYGLEFHGYIFCL